MSDKATPEGAQVIDLMAALKTSLAEQFPVNEYVIHTKEPESLSVGQLNRVVRELRELLYQEKLKTQAHQRAAEALRELLGVVTLGSLEAAAKYGPDFDRNAADDHAVRRAAAALAELDRVPR